MPRNKLESGAVKIATIITNDLLDELEELQVRFQSRGSLIRELLIEAIAARKACAILKAEQCAKQGAK